MMAVSQRVASLAESFTVGIADQVRALKAEGQDILELQTGDPDFATPQPVLDAAIAAARAGATHYGPSRGLPVLREAIARKLAAENGISADPGQEILVTTGAVHAITVAVATLVEPGDRVVIPDPAWGPYEHIVRMFGGIPVPLATDAADHFRVRPDALEEALHGARGVILNYPANPTGTTYPRDALEEIARVVEAAGAWVIADEVYERLLFDGRTHISFATLPGMRDRTVSVFSFSKTYAMTGWRVGYLAAPAALVEQMLKVAQYTITCHSPFVQAGAVAALEDPGVAQAVDAMVAEYAARRDLLVDGLRERTPFEPVVPDATFYTMVDVRSAGPDSATVARDLLDAVGLSTAPGAGYGPSAEGFIRLTFATSREVLEDALDRFERFAEIREPAGR